MRRFGSLRLPLATSKPKCPRSAEQALDNKIGRQSRINTQVCAARVALSLGCKPSHAGRRTKPRESAINRANGQVESPAHGAASRRNELLFPFSERHQ